MKFLFVFCGAFLMFLPIFGRDFETEKNIEVTSKLSYEIVVIGAPSDDCPRGQRLDQNGKCVNVDIHLTG